MRKISIIFLLILIGAIIASCSGNHAQVTASSPEFGLKSKLGDFKRKGNIKIYNGDDLWKYIDGAAESYLSYGFIRAAAADYAFGPNEITIQIFSFEKPIGAFGIYAENRSPDNNFIKIGAEGFESPGYMVFYKGQFLVRISSFNQKIESNLVREAGKIIESEIDAPAVSPIEYAEFPGDATVDHSERYLPSGFLDSDNLLSVFTAEAALDTFAATMFYFQDSLGLNDLMNWISKSGNAIEIEDLPYKAIFKNGAAQQTIIAGEKNGICFGVLSINDIPGLDSLFNHFSRNIK